MKKFFLSVLFLLLSSNLAAAYYGASNLGYSGYPSHSCREPTQPLSDDSYLWQSFIGEVEIYERCINDYVEAAKNDQKRIVEKANEAVNDYNSFVRYNS
mgnify:CR=1 FL=1